MRNQQLMIYSILILIISCVRLAKGLNGESSVKMPSNSLLMYSKFGFLSEGTIAKKVSFLNKPSPDSFFYLLICSNKAKKGMVKASKKENICSNSRLAPLMSACEYKQIIFNDTHGEIKILPFSNVEFTSKLVSLSQSKESKSITSMKSTQVNDITPGNKAFQISLQNSLGKNRLLGFERGRRPRRDFSDASDSPDSSYIKDDNKNPFIRPIENHSDRPNYMGAPPERDGGTHHRDQKRSLPDSCLLKTIIKEWIDHEDPLTYPNINIPDNMKTPRNHSNDHKPNNHPPWKPMPRDEFMNVKNSSSRGHEIRKGPNGQGDGEHDHEDHHVMNPDDLIEFLGDSFTYPVKEKGRYWFILMNCNKDFSVQIDFTLMNPRGEHLSTGELENKKLYFSMTFVWAFLSSFWIVIWSYSLLRKRKVYNLYHLLLIASFCWLIYSIIAERYWITYSHIGKNPFILQIISSVMRGCGYSQLLILFVLIGKGYTYINRKFRPREKRELCIFAILRIFLSVLNEFFGTNLIINITIVLFYNLVCIRIFFDFQNNLDKMKKFVQELQLLPISATTIQQQTESSQSNQQRDLERQQLDQVTIPSGIESNTDNISQTQQGTNVTRSQEGDINTQSNLIQGLHQTMHLDTSENMIISVKKFSKVLQWMRIFILCQTILLCLSYISSVVVFQDSPYIPNLWNQTLLASTYIMLTWFFYFCSEKAFTSMEVNDEGAITGFTKMNNLKVLPFIDVKSLEKITGNLLFIENAFGDTLKLASQVGRRSSRVSSVIPGGENKHSAFSCRSRTQRLRFKLNKKQRKYVLDKAKSLHTEEINTNEKIKTGIQDALKPEAITFRIECDEIKSVEVLTLAKSTENIPADNPVKVMSVDAIYPEPKFEKPIDYRQNMNDESIHNQN